MGLQTCICNGQYITTTSWQRYQCKFVHGISCDDREKTVALLTCIKVSCVAAMTCACRPNFENFMSTVQLLKEWGADLTQTKLSAKHIKCPQLPDVGGH